MISKPDLMIIVDGRVHIVYKNVHRSSLDGLSTIGNILLRLPTWDTYPDETQRLMLAFGDLQSNSCPS